MPWDTSPHQDRFDPLPNEKIMKAVVTAGNGGFEQLQCRMVKHPRLGDNEVLIRVLAAGINNTEINTRIGWYSDSVNQSTSALASSRIQQKKAPADSGWNETTPFPFIQGTDCCGEVVQLGQNADSQLLNKRVLVRSCRRPQGFTSMENFWMGSDSDGAFAEYVTVPQSAAFEVK